MEIKTKVELSEYKGHDILSIVEGKYNRMSAGFAKWKDVLNHIDEIKAFVEKQEALAKAKELAAEKKEPKTTKAKKVVDFTNI